MFKNFKINKIYIAIFLFLTVAIILFALLFCGNKPINGTDKGNRIAYLYSLGYKAKNERLYKITAIPEEFNKTFNKYNILQQKAGFNLKSFCGKKVKIYYYKTENISIYLIIYKGEIIGGHILKDYNILPLVNKQNGKNSA